MYIYIVYFFSHSLGRCGFHLLVLDKQWLPPMPGYSPMGPRFPSRCTSLSDVLGRGYTKRVTGCRDGRGKKHSSARVCKSNSMSKMIK